MAKKKSGRSRTKAAPQVTVDTLPAPAVQPIGDQRIVVKRIEYAFPNKSRCPRCRSTNTECISTVGAIQYRKCRGAVCRNGYKVSGTPI
jgi:hypothetical protein